MFIFGGAPPQLRTGWFLGALEVAVPDAAGPTAVYRAWPAGESGLLSATLPAAVRGVPGPTASA